MIMSALERKANKGETELAISKKADSSSLEEILNLLQSKADAEEMQDLK